MIDDAHWTSFADIDDPAGDVTYSHECPANIVLLEWSGITSKAPTRIRRY